MPSKAEWEDQLQRIYDDKATVKQVAEELNVSETVVRQRYERFLKKILEEKEKKLEKIDKEVDEKERRVKSLSEGIERADKKLKETEEKMPEVTELEKTSEELEERIENFSTFWQETKKTIAIILIILGITVGLGFGTYHFIINQPNIETSYINVTPKRGFIGDNVEVSFQVVNRGRDNGRYNYSMSFDNEVIEEGIIPLDPKESREVKVSQAITENGTTQVKLNGHESEFRGYKKPPYEGVYCRYEVTKKGLTENIIDPEIRKRLSLEELLRVLSEQEGLSLEELLKLLEDYKGINEVAVIEENDTHFHQISIPTGEIEDIETAENFKPKKTTPISIRTDEWEKFGFDTSEKKDTKFGEMKLARYYYMEEDAFLGKLPHIHILYLEENTNLPIIYKEQLIISDQNQAITLTTKKLKETNISYLSDLKGE